MDGWRVGGQERKKNRDGLVGGLSGVGGGQCSKRGGAMEAKKEAGGG